MEKKHGKVVIARFYPKEHYELSYWTGKMNGAPIFLFHEEGNVIVACLQNDISSGVFDKNNFAMASPAADQCDKGSDGSCDGKCVDGGECPIDDVAYGASER